jgi:hypothetical protein
VYHQTGHSTGKSGREALDEITPRLAQQISGSVEVDDRERVVLRNVAQQVLQLIGILGVHLGGHSRLPEPPLSQTQQCVVAGQSLLKQPPYARQC